MRIRITLLLSAFLVLASLLGNFSSTSAQSPTSTPAPLILTRSLHTGSSGSDVSALQKFLKEKKYFSYPTITGYFGPVTFKAVAGFQGDNKIEAIGIVGPKTRAKIKELTTPSATTTASTTPPIATNNPSSNPWWIPVLNIPFFSGAGISGASDTTAPVFSSIPNVTIESALGASFLATYFLPTATDNYDNSVSVSCSPASATTFAMGATTVNCTATDDTGNSTQGSFTLTVQDTTGPVFTSIAATQTSATTATITWTSNETADSQVEYGLTDSYGSSSTIDATLVTSHTVNLTGLTSGATYHYRVRSADSHSNVTYSSDATFSLTLPQTGDAVLWGQRLSYGAQQLLTNGSASIRYAMFQIFIGVPNWDVTSAQFVFPNFTLTSSNPAEGTTTRTVDIIGAEIWSGNPESGGTAIEALKFGGASTVSVPVASSSISDAMTSTLTAGTPVYMRLAVDRNLNSGSVPIGIIRQHTNGEKWQYFNTSAGATNLLTTGTITDDAASTTSSRYKGYGPMLAIGKGWDGRKVVLLTGHSLVQGGSRTQSPDDAADSRGNKVFISKALDSSSLTGGRISFGNIATPSISIFQQSLNPLSSDWYYRNAVMQSIAFLQGGRYPFTDLYVDIATNNGTANSYDTWKAGLDSNITFMKTLFPGIPVIMPTMTPRTTNLNSQFWTTVADQSFNSLDGPGPSAARQLLNAYILTKPNIEYAIDMSSVLAGSNDTWPATGFTTTLNSSGPIGTSTVLLNAAPSVGAILVFDPGVSGTAETVSQVKSVTGSGPYNVTFTEATLLTKAHSSGATVTEAAVLDGVHSSINFNDTLKTPIINAINALALP